MTPAIMSLIEEIARVVNASNATPDEKWSALVWAVAAFGNPRK